MKFLGKILFLTLICMFNIQAVSQTLSFKKSVLLEAETQNNPPAIELHWNLDFTSQGYKVFRRNFGEKEWGTSIAELPLNSNSYFDILVLGNNVYEYKIEKETIFGTAYGYICSSVQFEGFEFKGKMLLFVDDILSINLVEEIDQYRMDMALNGWRTEVFSVSPETTHFDIKEIINTNIDNPLNDMILLIGDVAVPYSGNINPDGIPQHKGAWPCDGYYGELDGIWTDNIVFNILNDERNHNIPNDGKFDQSEFPNDVEIPVGRLDFSNLTESETEYINWTAAYLNKLHQFKHAEFYPENGCILQDELSDYVEAYAQNSWKNAGPLVGIDNIQEGPYRASLLNNSYFLSYANGIGSFDNCENVISTEDLKSDSLSSIVTILYGSYFADWDSPDNLLMASLLKGNSLASLWAGRPNWQIHSMGLGFPIGKSLVNIQNNISLNYNSGIASKGVHISLLGDPSLEAFPAAPLDVIQVSYTDGTGSITWDAYPAEDVLAYHIYELVDYQLIPIATVDANQLNFTLECLEFNTPQFFVVRASFIEETFSGTFINHSIGKSIELLNTAVDWTVVPSYDFTQTDGQIIFSNNSINAESYQWFIDGQILSTEEEFTFLGELETSIEVLFIASNECVSDTIQETIFITDLKQINPQIDWTIYPNPATENLRIGNLKPQGILSILDINGKEYFYEELTEDLLILNVEHLKSGIYFVVYKANGLKTMQKLIIH